MRRRLPGSEAPVRSGGDPYEVSSEEQIKRHPGPRGHRHCPRCFCASSYKPTGWMARDRGRRVHRWSMRRCEDATRHPRYRCGIGTSRSTILCAIFSDPDESGLERWHRREPVGASRCRVGTRRACRVAIARGRWCTPRRMRDCAAAPRSAPTCIAPRPGAGGSAGARGSPGNRATTARARRGNPARDARCAFARRRARARRRVRGRAAPSAPLMELTVRCAP